MNEQVKNNIMEYKQKYLQKLTDAQVPEKLEKQLEEMDWTCLELIHRKNSKEERLRRCRRPNFSKSERRKICIGKRD